MKGIFFTISSVMLAMTLLSLSSVILYSSEDAQQGLTMLSVGVRMQNIDSEVSDGFDALFDAYSGIDISIEDNEVSFTQSLPNSKAALFKSELIEFESFVESRRSEINMDLTQARDSLPLTIMPAGIKYSSEPYGGSKIHLAPKDNEFAGYSVSVILEEENVTSCEWSASAGDMMLTLDVEGSGESGCSDSQSVSFSSASSIVVGTQSGCTATISIDSANLTVQNSCGATAIVTASVLLNDMPEEQITIYGPSGIINIAMKGNYMGKRSTYILKGN